MFSNSGPPAALVQHSVSQWWIPWNLGHASQHTSCQWRSQPNKPGWSINRNIYISLFIFKEIFFYYTIYKLWGNSRVVHGPPWPPPSYATAHLHRPSIVIASIVWLLSTPIATTLILYTIHLLFLAFAGVFTARLVPELILKTNR